VEISEIVNLLIGLTKCKDGKELNFLTKGWVTAHVEASPEVVYGIVSDVTRMGDWSPQTYRCAWSGVPPERWLAHGSRPVIAAVGCGGQISQR
jgi:hypothetical protein